MTYSKGIFFLLSVWTLLLYSCGEEEVLSPIPEIEFVSFSKDTLRSGNKGEDIVVMTISFVDGDGDLNRESANSGATLVITDLRTNAVHQTNNIPSIDVEGAAKGEMSVDVFNECCIYPAPYRACDSDPRAREILPLDQFPLSVRLVDRAGNVSNEITTPALILKCE